MCLFANTVSVSYRLFTHKMIQNMKKMWNIFFKKKIVSVIVVLDGWYYPY
jgi:hypothetical protein